MVRMYTGRKKIEMVKMTNPMNLQVTFCKRRSSLFKKASELCTLCGVNMALIVFSPGGKAFSFAHPNMDLVLDRYSTSIENYPHGYINNTAVFERNIDSHLQYLNETFTKVSTEKEEENAKAQKNKMMRNEMLPNLEHWYMNPPEEFNLTQAIQMKNVVEEFMKALDEHYPQFNPTTINHQIFDVESSSNGIPDATTIVHGDYIYTNQSSVDQMRMITSNYDPNIMMNQGYNHGQNQDQFPSGNRYY